VPHQAVHRKPTPEKYMRKRKPHQEKKMPTPQQNEVDLDAKISQQLMAEKDTSVREAAALEEKMQAEKLAAIKAANEKAEQAEEEPLVSVAARGREYLMEKMREHAEKSKKAEYVPPPMTDRMRANINAEMEAGRRAQAKHEAQQASRPVPVKEKWDGSNTKVYRPGDVVPDPMASGANQFAGVPPTYDK
jgi:hypothetical protein